jgi:uncharacterized membrane protein YjgN (DUF898 family)
MDEATSEPAQTAAPSGRAPIPLRFTGSGAEYFGIWIVNLLLSIVTLGIYSAWAKVRRLKFFYRHTELAGSSFDYHGSAVRILIGRLVALGMLIVYNVAVRLHSPLTVLVLLAIAILMPWLLRNSLRFRLYNTSWRGTRFHFRGTAGSAYRVFLLNGFLTVITLYLLAPFMHQRLKAWQHDNSFFGRTQASFHARTGQFYAVYALVLAALVLVGIVVGASGIIEVIVAAGRAHRSHAHVDPRAAFRALAVLYAGLILIGLSIGPAFHALITNLVWNHTRIGEHRIECHISPWRLIWISISNLLLVALSLGLLGPWARVRVARYQIECIQLLPASDLQDIVAAEPEDLGAAGEEAASVFDFDISL